MHAKRTATYGLIAVLLAGTSGCVRPEASDERGSPKRERAATGSVQLSADELANSGFRTAEVVCQSMRASLPATGWLAVKPGHEVTIKAASTGFVMPLGGERALELGTAVSRQQPLGTLQVFVSPQEAAQLVSQKEEVDTLIRQSLVAQRIAELRLNQLKDAKDSTAGKELRTLEATVEQSRAAYEEARDRLPFLPSEPYEQPLRLAGMALESPLTGQVTAVHVQPRQCALAGDPLWTISDWSTLWVRVPVFEGDLGRVDRTSPAEVCAADAQEPVSARPSGVPQPVGEGRRTLDLFYELDNARGRFRPGQAVSVALPTDEPVERLVVPRSAILWDGLGNAWVYLQQAPDRYCRQHVRIGGWHKQGAWIEQGVRRGQRVVEVGAEVLYAEEFRSQIQVEDD